MKMIWLSHPLDTQGPRPPAIPEPSLEPLYSVDKDGAKVQILRTANHMGSHLDAPSHVIADGLTILDYSPEELIFTRPVVIDLKKEDKQIVSIEDLEPYIPVLQNADIALFRFGYDKVRKEDAERFSCECPGFGVPSARFLREQCPDLKAIGMDVPSVATIAHLEETMAVHNELLGGTGRKFLILEEMVLEADLSTLKEVRVNPWLVENMDSGPCTIVGILNESRTRA